MVFDRATLDKLYQYCMALCNDGDEAYDLLYQSIEMYLHQTRSDIANPVAYVRRIARNAHFDKWRRQQVVQFESLPEEFSGSTEKALEATVVDEQMLDRVWEELTPPERETLYFWALEEMSATEIGLHLEQPRASVLSRLRRIRQRINRLFPESGSGGQHE